MKKIKILSVSLLAAATALCGVMLAGCGGDGVKPSADICTLDVKTTFNSPDKPTHEITAAEVKGIKFAWSIAWEDSENTQNLSSCISFAENGYTATIQAKQLFAGRAILSATWGKGGNAYTATKSISYSEALTLSENTDYCVITGTELEAFSDLYTYVPTTYNGKPIKEIGDNAFKNNTELTSITIPGSVVKIGAGALAGCTSLTSIFIPDSVTYIGYETFMNCTSLVNVVLPQNITDIKAYMFSECTSLASITIPAKVTAIYTRAFFKCSSLTEVTFLGDKSKIKFYENAFSSCPYQP